MTAALGAQAKAPAPYTPKIARTATATLTAGLRRILVVGAGGTGKTTLSISASKFAGDKIPRSSRVVCSDVVVFQGDNEGIVGAYNAGFEPGYVYDLSDCTTWVKYETRLIEALADIRPLCGTQVKYAVIDLGIVQRLITGKVKPDCQRDWSELAALGEKFFAAFSGLPGTTIIGNAHIKSSQGITETAQSIDAANARAIGGERAKFTVDLNKGVGQIWKDHSSLMIQREMKRVKVKDGVEVTYTSHTQPGMKYEAKSRFCGIIKPTEPGERTLHSILKQAYGDAL